jgi:hypothetical protein
LFQRRCVSLFFYVVDVDVLLRQNAFSDKLTPLSLNMFDMLVVDLMHEVELGVWKTVFIHLLRLLDCHDENLKHELDQRRASIEPLWPPGTDFLLGFKTSHRLGLMA